VTRELLDYARRTGTPVFLAPADAPSNLSATMGPRWPVFLVERRPVHVVLRVRTVRKGRLVVDRIDHGREVVLAEGTPGQVAAILRSL
jgi:hypothetical protein